MQTLIRTPPFKCGGAAGQHCKHERKTDARKQTQN